MKGTKTVPVEVRMSRVSSPTEGLMMHLSVIDTLSRMSILDVRLSPLELFKLVENMDAVVDAQVPGDEEWAHVGKKYEYSLVPQEEVEARFSRAELGSAHDTPTEAMEVFGNIQARTRGYDGYRWSRHNYGWGLGVYRWVDVPPAED